MTSIYHLDEGLAWEENNQVCLGRESKKVCWGSITVECEMVGLREREREREWLKSMRDRRESIGRKLDRIEFRIKIFFAFYLSRQKQFQFILRGGGRRKKNNLFCCCCCYSCCCCCCCCCCFCCSLIPDSGGVFILLNANVFDRVDLMDNVAENVGKRSLLVKVLQPPSALCFVLCGPSFFLSSGAMEHKMQPNNS